MQSVAPGHDSWSGLLQIYIQVQCPDQLNLTSINSICTALPIKNILLFNVLPGESVIGDSLQCSMTDYLPGNGWSMYLGQSRVLEGLTGQQFGGRLA